MKILVTGASGYLGRYILPLLKAAGHEVHAVSSHDRAGDAGVPWEPCDLLAPGQARQLLDRVRPEALIHLAWYAKHGSFWTARENLAWADATAHLLEAFRVSGGRRVVLAGTCAEYDWSQGYCVEDRTPTNPRTLYGKCKDATRQFVQTYCEESGLSYAWGRVFFPYGVGEPAGRLLPSVLRALHQSEPVRCTHGRQFRDFLHVSDVAAALVHLAVGTAESGVFNIASGQPVRLGTVVELCASHFERAEPLQLGAIPVPADDPPMLVGSADKLMATGWRPRVTLEEGIAGYARSYIDKGR
ncbi:NAD-dependent epimerase/dehydratase family protein [Rhodoferax mekongensis]|uniref:NAD(P)-dependent oxidoreductase n=1 Tax=Rhodoferax mekongensis TaxID=3068341 RepID=A0ABZ0AVQ3_9BURK|nr:NAD(P)-dependent oxidoreductase [Rhodoferax sp. TBRC 17307]WNO03718.1 NAD(P)-dependent oxidoreductase [Rhodoferax sp. TBRC 17307]